MVIGFDASRVNITKNKTGVERYSANLLYWFKKLDGRDSQNRYILYTPSSSSVEFDELPSNFQVKESRFPFFWTQLRFASQLIFGKNKPDIVFIPSNAIPFFAAIFEKNIKKVVTVHDVAFRHFPSSYSFLSRFYLNLSVIFALKFADRIIAISETTKQDLIRLYGGDEKKIAVTYLGFDEPKSKQDNFHDSKWTAVKEKFKINKPFLLFIGRIEKKKNIANLLKAFYEVLASGADLQLVLVGGKNSDYEEVDILVSKYNLQERVIFTGYATEAEKDYLLHNALLFVFLSRYEGFGIPVLEAFHAGLPVVASDIPVFQELFKDAAVLVDPYRTNEIAVGIEKVLKDKRKRTRMIEKGKELVKEFSWEKCARETLEILNRFNNNVK